MAEQFRSAFTKNELLSAATIALVLGQYNRIGQYVVQAGEIITPGYGALSGQENAVGRVYMKLMDNSTAPGLPIAGKVRLSVYSPQDRPLVILYEYRTETLDTAQTDRTKQIPFPEAMIGLSEDKKLVLEFLPDTAGTLSKANSTIIMDITAGTV